MATDPELRVAAREATAVAVRFASALRAANLRADLGAVIGFARALTLVDLGSPDEVRSAGSALFVQRPEQRRIYAAVFDRFWLRQRSGDLPEISHGGDAAAINAPNRSGTHAPAEPSAGGGLEPEVGEELEPVGDEGGLAPEHPPAAGIAYSADEVLRTKSFEAMSPDEVRDATRLIEQLRPRLARRRTRRYRLHRHGLLLAPRVMMRRSLGTGGDALDWIWRRRRTQPRRIVVVCDISGSMEQHSRFALRFVHALSRVDVRTEAFVFGTRLTRITSQLRHRNADDALREVTATVDDWAGGTQIGQALHVFNREWGRRVLRSSAIVIIVSDGWDRGSPYVVANEMELLSRRCHRVVWLNPLAATAGYEPRTAGMAAAFPFIDDFLPIRDVASLERLGEALGRLPRDRHRPSPSRAPAPFAGTG